MVRYVWFSEVICANQNTNNYEKKQSIKIRDHNDKLLETTYKIREYFDEYHIENLRSAVHKLFTCASDGKKWEVVSDEISLNELIKILKELMEDGFQTLIYSRRKELYIIPVEKS
ncbi:hypothetical protein OKW96_14870 [Sphingobacterium sp. KU25419]|nr:hypothetical protein OKW96_14870 [Sphingobacterium sp. KU25419]